jgi:hypothetical protein
MFGGKYLTMPTTNDPAATGTSHIIVSESPVRAPLDGFTPWTAPGAPAVGSIPIGFAQQVRTVPLALVDLAGGKQNRQ